MLAPGVQGNDPGGCLGPGKDIKHSQRLAECIEGARGSHLEGG